MKRFHVHVAVDDLAANIRLYEGAEAFACCAPAVRSVQLTEWASASGCC